VLLLNNLQTDLRAGVLETGAESPSAPRRPEEMIAESAKAYRRVWVGVGSLLMAFVIPQGQDEFRATKVRQNGCSL
jgi:hypothetical protein